MVYEILINIYMRYFDTFSGIGGFPLGIQQAYVDSIKRSEERGRQENSQRDKGQGLLTKEGEGSTDQTRQPSEHTRYEFNEGQPTCIGFSEIDKYATEIYQRHFPNHINYGDITKIVAEELPDFDLLVGGFPCQAFSIAGKRGGFEDTRGTMFFELARILRAKQPRLFVFENVKGLLSHDGGKSFATIVQTLDELGYDCQWQIINSKNHGVPQNRERVFIIGNLRRTSRPEVFPFGESSQVNNGENGQGNGNSVAYCLQAGNDKHRGTYINQLNQPTHSNDRAYGTDGLSPTLNTMQGGNRQPFIRETKDGFHQYRDDKKKRSIQGTHVTYPQGKCHALSTAHKPMTIDDVFENKVTYPEYDYDTEKYDWTKESKIRRLTPTECERLQGFPDGWTEGVSDTQRYKTLGNAVTVNVIRDIFLKIIESET